MPIDPDVDLRVPADRGELSGRRVWAVLGAVAAGGALGAVARRALQVLWPTADGTGFPWGTVLANVVGCALIGVLMVLVSERTGAVHPLVRPFLGVGVLGGFTSVSAYALDGVELLDGGAPGAAVAYLAGTLVTALAAVAVGARVTRVLVGRGERGTGEGPR